ncbi:hypothetical protein [Nonomuraea helvata]|uniref:Uncharacterized protein n=1 Tax=Nonomuraea helvata TaxID=37484 RepID=A0ABV5S1D8_9ACTN
MIYLRVVDYMPSSIENLTGRHGERLDAWIATIRADDLPYLHTFANGLERDHAAVLNGLALPYSSGAVEGIIHGPEASR